ncbi:hypothetical protein BQ9231_00610 [Cedratvirus lausannensis]|uniref:BTB domain-containing protein n=1 Tax=Cedratvirus lausannensis TaxID=2023205 RepID=A0A285PXU5_9VIRU|nr:hypothetical protein BQ9231_00610 [Cedratvirus lausannensis]
MQQARRYNLLVLDKLYPIDESMLRRSGYLDSLFSGRFGNEETKRFSLNPSEEEAFQFVYDYLSGEEPVLPVDLFPEVLNLASFLDIPDLIDYLVLQIGKIPLHILRSVQPLPQIEVPLAEYFLRNTSKFALLPPWVQEFFIENQTKKHPKEVRKEPLLLFIRKRIKPNKGKKVKFGACVGETRPNEIDIASIPYSIRAGRRIYDYRDKILTCPKKYPRLNLRDNWDVCCSKKGNLNVELGSLLESSTPVETDLGLVFVPTSYNKDFIFTRGYNYITRLNAYTI